MKLTKFGVIALTSGFALMAFELVAARILAPTIGSSTYVWTNVIGIIMVALTFGYWAGGKLADARKKPLDIAALCLATAFAVLIVLLSYEAILSSIATAITDSRWQGLIAAIVLFAPSSFLLGVISPYLVKLNLTNMASSGQAVASLSALNAVGSIAGTFLTGFVLFELIGSRATFVVVILLLVAASWLIVPKVQLQLRIIISAGILATTAIAFIPIGDNNTAVIDTPIATYVVKTDDTGYSQDLISLITGPGGTQSAIYKDGNPNLVFWYTQSFAEVAMLTEHKDHILVLGGGTFTFPSYLADKYPDSQIDVVEIDPGLEHIARDYFRYEDQPNLNLIFEDARTYVNRATEQYDLIFVDVFSNTFIPWQFATAEYSAQIAKLAKPDAVVVVNLIATIGDRCLDLWQALDAPYSAHFDHRLVKFRDAAHYSNIIAVYSRQEIGLLAYHPLNVPSITPYTDDFAPIEKLQQSCR